MKKETRISDLESLKHIRDIKMMNCILQAILMYRPLLQAQQPLNRFSVLSKCFMQFSPALIMCHIHFRNETWALKVNVKITGDSETKHGTAESVVKHSVLGQSGRITF